MPRDEHDAGIGVRARPESAELEQAFALRDRNYRSSVFALKRDAHEVATAAQQLAKDKSAGKPTVDAAKSIAEAATRFAEAVDFGVQDLKKEFDLARGGFAKDAKEEAKQEAKQDGKGAADDGDEAGSALLDPERLLAQLNLCKRDPARRVNFGFVDGHERQPPALALHPKTGANKLFSALQAETGVKSGAFGTVWVEGTVLTLQLDKPMSGLVKKVRIPVRACGFRVTQVVIWNADGSVFEQDAGDGESEDQPEPYALRRTALQKRYLAALQGPAAGVAKLRAVSGFADEKAKSGNMAAALQALDMLEKLMAAAEVPAAAAPAAAEVPAAAAPAARAMSRASARLAVRVSRLAWEQTRAKVRSELKRLEAVVLDEAREEPDFADIQANSGVLYTVLDYLDERLTARLDDSLNAQTAPERRAFDLQALGIVNEYITFARSDTLLADICGNGFADVPIRALLDERLNDLSTQLTRATAH